MNTFYVIGHKNPDTDSVISAILYANLRSIGSTKDKYVPAVAGELNDETTFVLAECKLEKPMLLTNASNKKLILVDHNEQSQWVSGASIDDIVGIIDHHKLNFNNNKPIDVLISPVGSTCSIIYSLYQSAGIEFDEKLKKAALCAILSDTVILKSVTTTMKDEEIVLEISKELNIDYKELGLKLFSEKAKVMEKTEQEILYNDYKDFQFGTKKFGIGQIELPELKQITKRFPEIVNEMKRIKESKKYHTMLLMCTDIMEEGSIFLIVSDEEERICKIYDTTSENNATKFLKNIMSRKRQVAATLSEHFQ